MWLFFGVAFVEQYIPAIETFVSFLVFPLIAQEFVQRHFHLPSNSLFVDAREVLTETLSC